MKFLNDVEIIEGIVGAVAFLFTVWYFRDFLKWDRIKSAAFIFPITWIIRKFGVNFYKHLKDKNIFSLRGI
jgi:hypothetical protein